MNIDNNLNSIITIEDSETDLEAIDLNSNSDIDMICPDDSICNSKNDKHLSLDNVDANTVPTACPNTNINESIRLDNSVPQPAFKVMFRDENISRQYREQIKDFLYKLVQSNPSCKEDAEDASNLTLEIWDNKDNIKDTDSFIAIENNDRLSDTPTDDSESNLLFRIDNQPNLNENLDIPTYGQKYGNTSKKSDSEASKDAVPKLNCFNCNGNHNMRDCKLPRNQANINKNRKEFLAKCNTGVRYHMSEDQRFSHMIPGQLSSKLYQALGLKDNQLPVHIYQMRLLGYPPGWLEEARLQHSGLSLFNSDGVAEADPNDEEGEIIANEDRDRYDLKKIYEFPGFNVPPPSGITDDSHKFWVPQMQFTQSKEMMLLQLQGKKAENGYKRKKLKLSLPIVNTSAASSDMEIEDAEDSVVENVPINDHFVPPLPKESVPTPPVPPSSGSSGSITEDSDSQSRELPSLGSVDDANTDSPSLSDLESTKKKLLTELQDISSNCTPIKNDSNIASESETPLSDITSQSDYSSTLQRSLNQDCTSELQSSDPPSDLNSTGTMDTSLETSSYISATSSSDPALASPARQRSSSTSQCVKSVYLGTPILQSSSPYNKLPSSEKFSRDICDVLNFENLPDTTGKYEQMSGVLQRVRSTMAKLHQQT